MANLPRLKLVKQRGESDCGIAVVAMLAGMSYERARREWRHFIGRESSASVEELAEFLNEYTAYNCEGVDLEDWPVRLVGWSGLESGSGLAAVLLDWSEGEVGHWIAVERLGDGRMAVYDPSLAEEDLGGSVVSAYVRME